MYYVYLSSIVPVECLVSDGKLEAGDLEREDKPRYPVTLSHCLTQHQSLLMQHSEMRDFQKKVKLFLEIGDQEFELWLSLSRSKCKKHRESIILNYVCCLIIDKIKFKKRHA